MIQGGTSVNTIAQQAALELDLRSEDAGTLNSIVGQVQHIVARYQTPRWQHTGVQTTMTQIGDRPAGSIGDDHPLVQAARHSLCLLYTSPSPRD